MAKILKIRFFVGPIITIATEWIPKFKKSQIKCIELKADYACKQNNFLSKNKK